MIKLNIIAFLVMAVLAGCNGPDNSSNENQEQQEEDSVVLPQSAGSDGNYQAQKTTSEIQIDGQAEETAWEQAEWKDIKYNWLGEDYAPEDFQGRYKILWDSTQLYFLVEVVDDSLVDNREDPFDNWWEDDGVEIFIDEDYSGGNHQYSHNAFAYHILLNGDVVDMGADRNPHLYNEHIDVRRTSEGNLYTWEIAMRVYDSTYSDNSDNNEPVSLSEGKELGFGVSYNDSDESGVRENFIGSMNIEPTEEEGRNRGWIDAGVFGKLELVGN